MNEENNNSFVTQESVVPPVGETINQNVVNQPTQPVTNPIPPINPTPTVNNPTPGPKKNNTLLIIIIVIALGIIIGFIVVKSLNKDVYTDNSSNKEQPPKAEEKQEEPQKETLPIQEPSNTSSSKCLDDVVSQFEMELDTSSYFADQDSVRYYFDNNSKLYEKFDLISALSLDDKINMRVCYQEADGKNQITDLKFIDKRTNKEIVSTDTEDILKEMGLHAFGKYTEDVELVDVGDTLGESMDASGIHYYYRVTLKFKSGATTEAKYIVPNMSTKFEYKPNKTYSMTFTVKESDFDLSEYEINDIKEK